MHATVGNEDRLALDMHKRAATEKGQFWQKFSQNCFTQTHACQYETAKGTDVKCCFCRKTNCMYMYRSTCSGWFAHTCASAQPRDDVNARTVVFMLPYTNPINAYHQRIYAFRWFWLEAHCTHSMTSTQPHTDVNAAWEGIFCIHIHTTHIDARCKHLETFVLLWVNWTKTDVALGLQRRTTPVTSRLPQAPAHYTDAE